MQRGARCQPTCPQYWNGRTIPRLQTPRSPVSEPLTQHATRSDLSIPSNQSWHNVPFALADDGVLVYTAILDVSQQNIAIIGAYGSGKTNLLLHCARWLYDTGCANIRFTRKTEHGMVTDDGKPLPSHKRTIWIVDDADEALNPFSSAPEANELREALVNPNITVIARWKNLFPHCWTDVRLVWRSPAENVPTI
mgnify:CR=1 FL=1